ncbi:hypothetical protein CPB83DRAFT_867190 [Crepidotus variabilis]|uniref:Uncharacterized protein n=1 Tax=Crepidotus variabilis TaxID=179855 RepID=A0A9P6JV88_9AGAR|nr:hypothetical protein CPB83DRAFT_867190 [Crepidotus variabilis]
MDFDTAWCPACDKQIQPKRYFVPVPPAITPVPQPPPHHKGGLVSGTGRLRALKAQRQAQAAAAAAAAANTKHRLVIDNGPIPLYCSDACHLADINDRATDESRHEQPAPTKPKKPSTKRSSTASSSASSSSSASLSTPPKPLSSIEKFASAYNFPIPPPAPTFEEPTSPAYSTQQYTNGIMMAGKLISELCPTKPAAKQGGRYPTSPPEPTKITPGWNDGTGSSAWRSAVYNFTSAPSQQPALGRSQSAQVASPRRRTPSSSSSSVAMSHPSPLESSELIAQFNDKFTKRCEARMGNTSASSSTTVTPSCASPTRERSILASSAQGKLLVPDVKLKVRTGSSSSLSSMRSRTPLSAPATTSVTASGSSSRRSIRSPLSASLSHSDEDERYSTSFTLRRPTIETRSWSYDNVPTYPIMQLPPTKVTRVERRVVDGEECDVTVEVEVREERKRLFLFAPTTVCRT